VLKKDHPAILCVGSQQQPPPTLHRGLPKVSPKTAREGTLIDSPEVSPHPNTHTC